MANVVLGTHAKIFEMKSGRTFQSYTNLTATCLHDASNASHQQFSEILKLAALQLLRHATWRGELHDVEIQFAFRSA
jgi:hypothetical protein